MSLIERETWTVFVCPECGTLYVDLSSMCECLPGTELVQPERVDVIAVSRLRGAVAENERLREAIDRVVPQRYEGMHPNLTALYDAAHPPTGGQ